MGAYLVLFPRVRVRMLFGPLPIPPFIWIIPMRAWVVLGWWVVLQVLMGMPSLASTGEPGGGVAVWAHVGGFVAGVLLIRPFLRPELVESRRAMLLQRRSAFAAPREAPVSLGFAASR
jgi:membrane associated rhomboid family serine protease